MSRELRVFSSTRTLSPRAERALRGRLDEIAFSEIEVLAELRAQTLAEKARLADFSEIAAEAMLRTAGLGALKNRLIGDAPMESGNLEGLHTIATMCLAQMLSASADHLS